MTYYLYIPFTRKQFPAVQDEAVKKWIQLEKAKNRDVILCYKGEKFPQLPSTATVGVWLHGKPGPMTVNSLRIDSELARNFKSTSKHLYVTHKENFGEKTKVLVPQIADDMIKAGLLAQFNDQTKNHLRIKLFFFEAGQQASVLADAFLCALRKDKRHQQGHIRVDYYPGQLSELKETEPGTRAFKSVRSDKINGSVRAKTVRGMLYNTDASAPGFTIEQVNNAITAYHAYKSSRLHGLSGLLGLNGFFSSGSSAAAIKELPKLTSDAERFKYAARFLQRFPETQLAKCLRPLVQQSQTASAESYKEQPMVP